jgi:hypothetical protein
MPACTSSRGAGGHLLIFTATDEFCDAFRGFVRWDG